MAALYNCFILHFNEINLKIQTTAATQNDFNKDSNSPKKKFDSKLICDFL